MINANGLTVADSGVFFTTKGKAAAIDYAGNTYMFEFTDGVKDQNPGDIRYATFGEHLLKICIYNTGDKTTMAVATPEPRKVSTILGSPVYLDFSIILFGMARVQINYTFYTKEQQ